MKYICSVLVISLVFLVLLECVLYSVSTLVNLDGKEVECIPILDWFYILRFSSPPLWISSKAKAVAVYC